MEKIIRQTSNHFYQSIHQRIRPTIFRAKGWDIDNFHKSFYEEEITIEEFLRRLNNSDVSIFDEGVLFRYLSELWK